MTTKIELYTCERCEKKVSKPYGNDLTGVMCFDCWEQAIARAEAEYEAWKERDL